jgi:hypothetical protein
MKMLKKILMHVVLAIVVVASGLWLFSFPVIWNSVYMFQGWVFVFIALLAWLILALVFKRFFLATTAVSLAVVFVLLMFWLNFAHNAG